MLSDHELDQIEEDVQQHIVVMREIWAEHGEHSFTGYIEDDQMPRASEKDIASSRASTGPRH